MTWRELKNYINKKARERKEFLDTEVNVYDFKDGEEYVIDVTELLCGEDEVEESENSNWIPYLSINDNEDTTDETETKEASID